MTVGVIERRTRRRQPADPPRPATRGGLWALGQLVVIATLTFAILLLLAQPAFRPRDIRVLGVKHMTAAEVISSLALDRDRAIFFVDHAGLEQRVRALPWVRSADIRVWLPDHVQVRVTEWTPSAVLQVGESSYFVSEKGAVLGPAPEPGRLVVIDRPDFGPVRLGEAAVDGDLLASLSPLAAGFSAAFKVGVSSFELDAHQVLSLHTNRGWAITFGQMVTADDRASLEPKLAALRALSQRVDLTTAPILYINLMNPRAPAVRLRPR